MPVRYGNGLRRVGIPIAEQVIEYRPRNYMAASSPLARLKTIYCCGKCEYRLSGDDKPELPES